MGVLDGAGVLNTPSASTVTTASLTSTSSSSTSTSSATRTTSSSTRSSSTAATQVSGASAALAPSHTGRTIGLAVGISLGVCAIAAVLGIWLFFRKKLDRERRHRGELESTISAAGTIAKGSQLSAEKREHKVGPEAQEMDSSRRQELDTGGHAPYEAGGNISRHEVM